MDSVSLNPSHSFIERQWYYVPWEVEQLYLHSISIALRRKCWMDLNRDPPVSPEQTGHRRFTRKRMSGEGGEREGDIEQDPQTASSRNPNSPTRKQPRRAVRGEESIGLAIQPASATRQRGRPRLEAQEQSATEVNASRVGWMMWY